MPWTFESCSALPEVDFRGLILMEPHDRTFLSLPGRWLLSLIIIYWYWEQVSTSFLAERPRFSPLPSLRQQIWAVGDSFPTFFCTSEIRHGDVICGIAALPCQFPHLPVPAHQPPITWPLWTMQRITHRGRRYLPSFTSTSLVTPMIGLCNCDWQEIEYSILSTHNKNYN